MLNFTAICPHPMSAIPGADKFAFSKLKKTIQAMEKLSQEMEKFQIETVVIVSPHGPMRYDKFTVNFEESFQESSFGAGLLRDENLIFKNNSNLTRIIAKEFRKRYLPSENIRENFLDYGSLVPLYYLNKNSKNKFRVVPLTITAFDFKMHYEVGKVLREIFDQIEENIAFIASADLSQRVTEASPAGFSPYGAKFDRTVIDLLKENQAEKFFKLNPDFCQEAAECGLRSIVMALGLFAQEKVSFIPFSYESPLGTGHLVGRWKFGK